MLQHPDRAVRQAAHAAVTAGLAPGPAHPRLRVQHAAQRQGRSTTGCAATRSWISARNLANEATDDSVQALVDAVVARYDIPQRWYALKARILGVDRIADYDRMASVATADIHDPVVGGHRGGARRLLLVLAASWPASCSASCARSGSTRRPRPGKRRRRVLRVHRAVAPPVRAAQLDELDPRRRHPRPRARPRRARLPLPRAGRVPDEHPADARRDRIGVRRDGHEQAPAEHARRPERAAGAAGRRRSRTRSPPCSARSR